MPLLPSPLEYAASNRLAPLAQVFPFLLPVELEMNRV